MAFTPKLLQQGAGGGLAKNYIEDVFSTYLYTGNGSTQTITNGIDLSTKGGLVWLKGRSVSAVHTLVDTARGAGKTLFSDLTNAEATNNAVSAFNSNGFTMGDYNNTSPDTYVSWTFRKQPKFFDVVTWTGNGSAITVNHNLGSVPGCIIIKAFSSSPSTGQNWLVYHRSVVNQGRLNSTDAFIYSGIDNVTSTSFEPSGTGSGYNVSGVQYIGYVFAHDAGGFGLTGTDSVISCGTYTGGGTSAPAIVNLGWEPQWVMVRASSAAENWQIIDNTRGWPTPYPIADSNSQTLYANSSSSEGDNYYGTTSTGFVANDTIYGGLNGTGRTYIYVAIRRGPMKVPTSGTSLFAPQAWTGDGSASRSYSGGFVDDAFLFRNRAVVTEDFWFDRLRGDSNFLQTTNTSEEVSYPFPFVLFGSQQNGVVSGTSPGFGDINTTSRTSVGYHVKRAPSFFDVVCYTGVNSGGQTLTVSHNLKVTPELVIIKQRNSVYDWLVYSSATGTSNTLFLNLTNAVTAYTAVSAVSSSTFTASGVANNNTGLYVAYLFATCPGVSKVGSYTGTGTTLQVNCGFTGGARFVLIKRTDSSGAWYVWDTARGIVSGNDPYLLLNSSAVEVTNTDYVDTYSAGFELSSTAPDAINASGGTFIFLAIA